MAGVRVPDVAPKALWFLAIGASGGAGLQDIVALLRALPSPLKAVVMIVLHRPVDRVSHLRDVLARATTMPVIQAYDGQRFAPGRCYVGEPAAHLTLARRSFGALVEDSKNAHRNRTIDLLFGSVATCGSHRIIGVVLSGSLDDGSRGLAAIHAAGGNTMVLTPDDAVLRGMPENAISFDGPIDCIGSPQEIASAIRTLIN